LKRKAAQKERTFFQFRLREVDADLKAAIDGMNGEQLANMARDGLRLMLGIRTTKRVQVVDVPINSADVQRTEPQQAPKVNSVIGNQGLGTAFIAPNHKNSSMQQRNREQAKRTW
jgi:hypothetical protein